jgi:GNAT superfamily N-acetyltransferase
VAIQGSEPRHAAALLFGEAELTSLSVRAARPDDREALIGLKWQMNRSEISAQTASGFAFVGDLDPDRTAAEASIDNMLTSLAAGEAEVIVAEIGPSIVGYLAFSTEMASPTIRPECRRYGFIIGLVVDAGHRNKGIGSMLLGKAETLARSKGITRLQMQVSANNPDAERLYQRLGFRAFAHSLIRALD